MKALFIYHKIFNNGQETAGKLLVIVADKSAAKKWYNNNLILTSQTIVKKVDIED